MKGALRPKGNKNLLLRRKLTFAYFKKSPLVGRRIMEHCAWVARTNGNGSLEKEENLMSIIRN
jgi:hypothetical protein